LKSSVNVAVIGGGIIGASTAFYLSQLGSRVTIFEKGQLASGASGHSFAWINSFNKFPRSYHDFNHDSMERWSRFERLLNQDVGLKWGGNVTFATDELSGTGLAQDINRLQKWGYPSRLITKRELLELEPSLEISKFHLAAYTWSEGHVMTDKVIHACMNSIVENGGKVILNSRVDSVSQDSSGASVTVEGKSYPFDIVVVAGGVNTSQLSETYDLKLPQRVSPGVVVKTNPINQILRSLSVLQIVNGTGQIDQIHVRQDAHGAVMIGTGSQEHETSDDSQKHADNLVNEAARYIPGLQDATAIRVPVGFRPMPIDELPVIGFTSETPNIYVLLMHSGVTLAPLVGELASMEIVENIEVECLAKYRPTRF
jgi:glycine/D-amino acid oxidase-like deaminating enzyme|tara:strand:- start:16802 stop:17911 length:1110 start_codon:yes stop_codon:yes gene_type:complete